MTVVRPAPRAAVREDPCGRTGQPQSLLERLAAALQAAWPDLGSAGLEPFADTGLAHDHVRLAGTGWIARVPKQSQMRLAAGDNLAYQAACFRRASASGHAPRLGGVLEPSAWLPRGALIVEEISGRPARLPGDLPAIATALAQIHALPVPGPASRPPLRDDPDPLAALHAEIEEQAAHLDAAGLPAPVRRAIDAERAAFIAAVRRPDRPDKRLISFDAHPGNFIVRADGHAVLVDLEKARYSFPPLDLAHATLYTSTTWDVATSAELSVDDVRSAIAAWQTAFGPPSTAFSSWQVPLRRGMWLWSVTWCAKWRVLSARRAVASADGEDWSAERSEAALIDHVRGRVDCYLSAVAVDRVRTELAALEGG